MTDNNLTKKFTTLEQQLLQQNQALITAVSNVGAAIDTGFSNLQTTLNTQHQQTINALNTIIAALGAPPPGPSTTLADVVAAINALKGTADDIHTDTISMDGKLLRLREAIAPISESLPSEAHSSIIWSLYRIVDAIQPSWPRPVSVPLQPAVHQILAALVPGVSNLISTAQSIRTVLGPSGLTSTVLSELMAIHDCVCRDVTPDPTDPNSCESPYISEAIQAAAARNFAVFIDPPSGIEIIDDQFETGVPAGAKLRSTASDWDGYSIYVASRSAQLYAENEISTDRYPTNIWRPMPSGNYAIAPNVGPNEDIIVYICLPNVIPPPVTNCYDVGSQIVTVDAGAYHHVRYGALFPSSFQITAQFPFGEFWTHTPACIAVGNFRGWSIELLSGTRARCYTASTSNFVEILTISTVGGRVTFTGDCEYMAIDNYQSNEISPGAPFSVRLCEPEPV